MGPADLDGPAYDIEPQTMDLLSPPPTQMITDPTEDEEEDMDMEDPWTDSDESEDAQQSTPHTKEADMETETPQTNLENTEHHTSGKTRKRTCTPPISPGPKRGRIPHICNLQRYFDLLPTTPTLQRVQPTPTQEETWQPPTSMPAWWNWPKDPRTLTCWRDRHHLLTSLPHIHNLRNTDLGHSHPNVFRKPQRDRKGRINGTHPSTDLAAYMEIDGAGRKAPTPPDLLILKYAPQLIIKTLTAPRFSYTKGKKKEKGVVRTEWMVEWEPMVIRNHHLKDWFTTMDLTETSRTPIPINANAGPRLEDQSHTITWAPHPIPEKDLQDVLGKEQLDALRLRWYNRPSPAPTQQPTQPPPPKH